MHFILKSQELLIRFMYRGTKLCTGILTHQMQLNHQQILNTKPKINWLLKLGDQVTKGDVLYTGGVINKVFFMDISRFLLTLVFVLIGFHRLLRLSKKST